MEPNETAERVYFNSRYRHGVDEKRRVQIPAKWRPGKSGIELTLVVWPKSREGSCLRVLPPEKMSKVFDEILAMPNSDPNKGVLKRYIGSESVQVTVDQAGRICLPEDMAKEAAIAKDAVLVGVLDQFEIWNPERYERVRNADNVMAPEALRLIE